MTQPDEDDVKKRQQGFTFINISDPTDETKSSNRRLVRSRATTSSHRDGSRKAKTIYLLPKSRLSRAVKTPTLATSRSNSDGRLSASSSASNLNELQIRDESADLIPYHPRILALDSGSGEPFDVLPLPMLPWYLSALQYYRDINLPKGIELIQQSPAEGRAYIEWYMRESLSEACLLYMHLLNVCTALVDERRMEPKVIIWLRGHVVSSLNEALGDANRACSTPVLLTVASIAIHTRLFGDVREAREVHGSAFARMVEMRGGLESIEAPRIYFKILHWLQALLYTDHTQGSSADLLSAWAPHNRRIRRPG